MLNEPLLELVRMVKLFSHEWDERRSIVFQLEEENRRYERSSALFDIDFFREKRALDIAIRKMEAMKLDVTLFTSNDAKLVV